MDSNYNVRPFTLDLDKPIKINYTCHGKVLVNKISWFTTEYIYINDLSNTRLRAVRRFCGFDIYLNDNTIYKLRRNLIGSYYKSKDLEIQYTTSIMKRKKPRSFVVRYKHLYLVNKEPFHNKETNSYSLNFNGRVTIPSVKNFQMIHPVDQTYIILTFGKVEDNTYVMDYKYPMSALDAFSICLSAMDDKYFCD